MRTLNYTYEMPETRKGGINGPLLPLEVEYHFYKKESPSRDGLEPGFPAGVSIETVTHDGHDFSEIVDLEDIEAEIMAANHSNE